MEEFYPFFIIIFVGVFFSIAFRRIHVPWVVSLIIGGILIGPHLFNLTEVTPVMDFLGQMGIIFLMFMAGLETRLSSFKTFKKGIIGLSFVNGFIPFLLGILIALMFGYGITSSLLVGIIFVSSSIAVVIPSLERHGLLHTKLGQSVIMTTIIQDIASLIMLSVLLQTVSPATSIPLVIFYPLLFIILVALRFIVPKVRALFSAYRNDETDIFQYEFRAVFLILIGIVILFEILGLHPIIAGFFAGLVLAESLTNPMLKEKIRTISYGIFIPTFFVVIGMQTDISVFTTAGSNTLLLIYTLVCGSIIAKLVSGYWGARAVGFNSDESLLFGISSVPQLSTTLAVAFSALSFGFIDSVLITAMITLSIITTLVSPTLLSVFGRKISQAVQKK